MSTVVTRRHQPRFAPYRLRNIVAAALLAVLAAVLTLVYVSRAEPRAAAPAAASVNVLVATRDIAVGTVGARIVQAGWARAASVARNDEVAGAVVDPAQLKGLVATQTIYAGEQITTRRLGVATGEGIRASLHGALRIVDLPGDNHQLLAGTLRDGDHVDVVASIRQPESGQVHYARVVLRDLLVVGAATASGGNGLQGKNDAAVKLQLTDEQAQRLFWVERNADWTLALRPAGDATTSHAAAATASSVLRGPDGR